MITKRINVYGKIDWYNKDKGFGFAKSCDNKNENVFIHFAEILDEDKKNLKEGQIVLYDVLESNAGFYAARIRQPDE